jgi:hypothetical protein
MSFSYHLSPITYYFISIRCTRRRISGHESYLYPAITNAIVDSGVGGNGIACAHSVSLDARAVNPGCDEAFGQNASAILRQLLENRLVALIISVGFDHDLVIRVIGEERGERFNLGRSSR